MKNKLRKMIDNPFIQGGAILTIGNFFISFLNYIFNLFAGRLLGPQGYGEITALFSYTLIFSIPFSIFSNLIIQKIGSKENNQLLFVKMLHNWFFSKLKKWSFLIFFLILSAPFLPRLTNLSPFVSYSFIILIILYLFTVIYTSTLLALRFFLVFILISILGVLIKLSGILFVYFGIDGVNTIIFFTILSSLITFIIYYLFIRKEIISKIEVSKKLEKRLFILLSEKYTLITIFSILGITLLNNIDIIFVKKFFSPLDAGLYSAWSLFAKIIFYIIGPIVSISYIFFTSTKKNNQKNILFLTVSLIISISFFAFIFYSMFPEIIINIFFGKQFYLISKNLGLAAFFGMFYSLITLMNNYFLAKKNLTSLITIIIIPFYVISLFIFNQTIQNIMIVNIIYSFITMTSYFCGYLFLKQR